MINAFFTTVIKNLKLNYGLNSVIVDNKLLFRKIYTNILDEIIFTYELKELDSNSIVIINNLIDSDINDKKSITELYKFLDKYINSKFNNLKNELQKNIINYMDEISDSLDTNIEYEIDFDHIKFFQSINLKNKTSESLIENIINYLKSIKTSKVKLICTYFLNNFFDENELDIINSELEKNQIILLDISSAIVTKNYDLIIDKDLCIL